MVVDSVGGNGGHLTCHILCQWPAGDAGERKLIKQLTDC